MPRDNRHKLQLMRARIAAAAARLMAEDGIDDFALAKRKAARQLGADSTHALPDNAEVEEALRTYQSLYQGDELQERIDALREVALDAMEAFAEFRPYLYGAVLKGTAGKYGEIDLQLFTDDNKGVELYLLNHKIAYEVADARRRVGDQVRAVTVLHLEWDGVPLDLAIYSANDERVALRNVAGDRIVERAGIEAVRELVAAAWDAE
jgi:hypothetical protein